MQVEHANRVSDIVLALAGLIVTVAIFAVGYQVYINNNTIKKLKQENRKLIITTVKPLFIDNLKMQNQSKSTSFQDITDCVDYFNLYFSNDKEAADSVQHYLKNCVKKVIFRFEPYHTISEHDTADKLRETLNDVYHAFLDRHEDPSFVPASISTSEEAKSALDEGTAILEELAKLTNRT